MKPGGAIAVLALVGALSGCSKATGTYDYGAQRSLTKVTLQTDWYAQAEHGGFYQALAKGYYREAGLDVTIKQAGPNMPIGLLVATGNVQFLIGRLDETIVDIARDVPVKVVGVMMQHDPEAILVHEEGSVKTFADLNGKSVMTVPGANWIAYAEKRHHVAFNIIPLNFGMAQFMADREFIQQCFVTNEPFYVEKNGGHPRVILLAESGFDPYRIILANAEFVSKHPQAAKAFVDASMRGWKDYLNGDPEPANRIIESLNLQMTPDFVAYAIAKMKEFRLVTGDPSKGEYAGELSRRRIQEQIDILQGLGVLDRHVTVDDVVPQGFLTAD